MIPPRAQAKRLVADAELTNPGVWARHSEFVALCAQRIAEAVGMDPERAYVSGLLHDIGRKFGRGHLTHVYDGYRYMMDLGYDEVARICLTHSFQIPSLEVYLGNLDISEEKQRFIEDKLRCMEFDDYDRLIQLCDAMATSEGIVAVEVRIADVQRRYGSYPAEKKESILKLKAYFEEKAGKDLYDIVK